MAFPGDGSLFWSRLRPRPSVDPLSFSSHPVLPMDIWNLLDEFTGVPSVQGSTSRSAGSFVYEVHNMDRFFTDWLWLTNRNRERQEKPPEHVDTAAVLRKLHTVVYKPSSSLWGKAKVEGEQSECAVCLEKLVAKDKLFMLPCKHQFHVDCLTPWIKRNHACCPCCRADILRGPNEDAKASTSNSGRSNFANFQQWSNNRAPDFRSVASNQGYGWGRDHRNERVRSVQNTGRHSNSDEENANAWEGLHEYIMSALAEVDAELNRFMR